MDNYFWNVLARLLTLGFLLLPPALYASDAAVNSVQVIPAANYTRLIFKITEPAKYHVFSLAHPDRLVVDFDKMRLRADIKNLHFEHSALRSARTGWPAPDLTRIVFDTDGVVHYKSFIAHKDQGSQLVIEIYGKQEMAAAHAPSQVKVHTQPLAVSSAPKASVTSPSQILADISTTQTTKHKVHSSTDFDVSEFKKNPRPQALAVIKPRPLIIVVDAGHGGKDPGTIGTNGTREKDVVLSIATRLAELINQDPTMHATLTRKGDYFVPLKGRLQLARKDKADLFIAIHADSYFNDQSTGASVYALSQHGASSMAARWLADRENHSELGGVDLNGLGDHSYLLRSVLIDLAQTATIVDSVNLGTDILSSLESVTSLHYGHVEQAPFMVLKSPDIPSILVEVGFLSNQYEEERLRKVGYRDKLADALLAGIHQYVAMHPMMASNAKLETSVNLITNQA